MDVSLTQLVQWALQLVIPFFRISGFFISAPLFSAKSVPKKIKLFISIIMTIVIAPSVSVPVIATHFSAELLATLALQLMMGIFMGIVFQLVFQSFMMAGQLMGTQAGLGFASLVDPQNGVSISVVSQFYMVLTTLIFLAINGHLALVQMLIDSFTVWPVEHLASNQWYALVTRVGWVFGSALIVALPVVIALLVVNIGFGVMTKASPQLNIFTVGFPVTIVLGLLLMALTLPLVPYQFEQFFSQSQQFLLQLQGV